MFWFISIMIFAVSAYSEYYICQLAYKRRSNRTTTRVYIWFTAILWIAFAALISFLLLFRDSQPPLPQIAGIALFLFFINGISKAIFALFVSIGRRRGKTVRYATTGGIISFIIAFTTITVAISTTSRLRTETIEITSPKITPALDGFRIVLISDIHTGLLIDKYAMAEKIATAIEAIDPDIVVNGGDLINHDHTELDDRMMRILSGIKGRYGTYSVLGNHDLGIYIRDTSKLHPAQNVDALTSKERAMGWRLLRNASEVIQAGGDSIIITGLDYPDELIHHSHSPVSDTLDFSRAYAGTDPAKFNITISHAPQTWDKILETGLGDLTLSGHVHSLQSKIKLGKGRGWSPAVWLYERWSGLYTENGKNLYINDGIGYAMMPVRLGTRPEITVIELRHE